MNGTTIFSKCRDAILKAWAAARPGVFAFYAFAKPRAVAFWNRIRPQSAKGWTLWIVGCTLLFAYWQGYLDFQPKAPELRSSKEQGAAYEVFLVDPSDDPNGNAAVDSLPRYQELSIMRPFQAVVAFNRLVPGKSYQVSFHLRDASGTQLGDSKPFVFTPKSSSWITYSPYSPDYEQHSPGTWRLEVEVFGLGTITHKFQILAPTSDQRKVLARYEKAREFAFQSFSHYWLGAAMGDLSTFVAATGGQGKSPEDVSLAQVAGVAYDLKQDHVSPADLLNGITYRARVGMGFTVYRLYEPGTSWGLWLDVDRSESDMGEMMKKLAWGIRRKLDMSADVTEKPLAPGMRFEIYEQDGNWFVISDRGDFFVNGVLKGQRNPEFLKQVAPSLINVGNVFQPSDKVAMQVIQTGRTPRDVAREMGSSVKPSEQELTQQKRRTMDMIRGKKL